MIRNPLRSMCAMVSALLTLSVQSLAGAFVPDTGGFAVAQALLEMHARLRVMTVAVRPGDEDFAALAEFRFGEGAKLLSLYVTNGEGGESDAQELLPTSLAAARREEATSALESLDADCAFLNFPDIGAARSQETVRQAWSMDSLGAKVRSALQGFRPDAVILFKDRESSADSGFVWRAVKQALLRELGRAKRPSAKNSFWPVGTLWVRSSLSGAVTVPVEKEHRFIGKTYEEIGRAIGDNYRVLSRQIHLREQETRPRYAEVLTPSKRKRQFLEVGPPRSVPPPLRKLERTILALNAEQAASSKGRDAMLRRVAAAIGDANRFLRLPQPLSPAGSRTVLDWKSALERLRCSLLGVHVRYILSDSILAPRQLTYLRFEEVSEPKGKGTTAVYVPAAGKEWILNEGTANHVALSLKDPIRLISPQYPGVNYPVAAHGLDRPVCRIPLSVFIVHEAPESHLNFVYTMVLHFYFADKLSVEAITPIVRAMPGENLVVRLTNHSRDGLSSWLQVTDSLVSSPRRPFSLLSKESVWQDTLPLQFREQALGSTFVVPFTIEGQKVGAFVARSCAVLADTTRIVGLITGLASSATRDALHRAGFSRVRTIPPDSTLAAVARDVNVLIVDRRAMTLRPELQTAKGVLRRFVEEGGHLLILGQDVEAWESAPLLEGVRLMPDDTFEPDSPVSADTADQFWHGPNHLSSGDFDGWLLRRAYNRIALQRGMPAEILLGDSVSGSPLLVSKVLGKGRVTYTNLCLGPQWMNVSPGPLRLLANLVSR